MIDNIPYMEGVLVHCCCVWTGVSDISRCPQVTSVCWMRSSTAIIRTQGYTVSKVRTQGS